MSRIDLFNFGAGEVFKKVLIGFEFMAGHKAYLLLYNMARLQFTV